MNTIDREFNQLIMNEIGLEIDNNHNIVDQDSGNVLSFRGMTLVEPGYYCGKSSKEFDPYNDKKMMNCLFGHFLNKYEEENDNSVLTYFSKDDGKKGCVSCKMDNNSSVTSDYYLRDSVKYADIILRLNGDESPDLGKYDIEVKKETIKKKRSTSNAKNKSNSKSTRNSK